MNNHVHWCLSSMVNFSEPFVSFIFDCLQSIESNQIIKLFTHPNMIEGLSLILQDRRLGCWVKLSDKVRSHRWLQRTEKTKDGQEWSRRPWWIDWCVLCILMPFDRHIKRNDRLIIHVTLHTQFESTQHDIMKHHHQLNKLVIDEVMQQFVSLNGQTIATWCNTRLDSMLVRHVCCRTTMGAGCFFSTYYFNVVMQVQNDVGVGQLWPSLR